MHTKEREITNEFITNVCLEKNMGEVGSMQVVVRTTTNRPIATTVYTKHSTLQWHKKSAVSHIAYITAKPIVARYRVSRNRLENAWGIPRN